VNNIFQFIFLKFLLIYRYSYTDEANTLTSSIRLKEGRVCRELCYSSGGDKILLASSGNNSSIHIYDVNEGGLKLERQIKKATPAFVSCIYSIDENLWATGDDDGHVMCKWNKK
jgi:WD40 repeat protein